MKTTISCDWFVQLLTKPTIQRYLLNNRPQIVDQKNRPEQSESNICPENEMGWEKTTAGEFLASSSWLNNLRHNLLKGSWEENFQREMITIG